MKDFKLTSIEELDERTKIMQRIINVLSTESYKDACTAIIMYNHMMNTGENLEDTISQTTIYCANKTYKETLDCDNSEVLSPESSDCFFEYINDDVRYGVIPNHYVPFIKINDVLFVSCDEINLISENKGRVEMDNANGAIKCTFGDKTYTIENRYQMLELVDHIKFMEETF